MTSSVSSNDCDNVGIVFICFSHALCLKKKRAIVTKHVIEISGGKGLRYNSMVNNCWLCYDIRGYE